MKIASKFFSIVSGLCLLIVFIVTFAQVIQRYVFNMPLPWATDVIRITFIYSVFFGMCVGVLKKSHLNIDVVIKLVPERIRDKIGACTNLLVIAFLTVALRYSIPFIRDNADQVTPYLSFPMSYVYCVFPLTMSVMIVALAIDSLETLFGRPCADGGEGER